MKFEFIYYTAVRGGSKEQLRVLFSVALIAYSVFLCGRNIVRIYNAKVGNDV
jgi:hypothetical protein